LPSLRRIFFGGDLLTRQDVAATRRLAPDAKIVSFYGATETQRAVGYLTIDDDTGDDGERENPVLPTGKGAPAVQLLLLTPTGQLAGVGELGELYLRSPHLAAGYVGDDELTMANFVVNPFTGSARDRLYRTGELGRYRPNGDVEWVGRRDRRVSIRGFRVELAEVESTLLQYPAVRAAAVVENSKSPQQLTAYVVADDSGASLRSDLRAFLTARLPHYMVPGEFMVIERLPLSPNGKVDYDALALITSQPGIEPAFDPPRSVMEQTVAAIFAEVLSNDRVGRHDHFFHCGGHSLLAAQAVARIRQSLGIRLDLRLLFEAPTVAALAKRLEGLAVMAPTEPAREEMEL
jgi:acyl-coenzyme A synthetase/AMP-(fatty) acid ligase/acyl carrier protein